MYVLVREDMQSTDPDYTLYIIGTVIGNIYGLAKKATAIAVQVLDKNGSGTTR